MSTEESLRAEITAKGNEIKEKKAAGSSKDVIQPLVNELLTLKQKFQEVTGSPYDPPVEKKKEKKEAPPPAERTGPSKKELKKAERKEKKAASKNEGKQTGNGAPTSTPIANGKPHVTSAVPVVAKPTLEGDSIFFSLGRPPTVAYATASLTKDKVDFIPHPAAKEHVLLEPQLFLMDGTTIFGDLAIARFLARRSNTSLTGGSDAFLSSEVDQWLDFVQQYHSAFSPTELASLGANLNSHLESRTYMVGYTVTLADVAMCIFLQLNKLQSQDGSLPHVSRWFKLLSGMREVSSAHSKVCALKSSGTSGKTTSTTGTCPPLEGAVEGQVVTRFPPEPSGFLHIGHAKAVLLNDYYAKFYKGRLIIRFDDTNPSKEKDEYEESIIADLASLGVKGDVVTHTSDYFEEMQKYAVQMIKEGKAYMDNTPQEVMQEERLNRKESVHRNDSVAESLERFQNMLDGSKEYCLRAKIDMTSVNGTMRDPVLYRANPTPHHRTGTKYKAYPTYDFACPIVDSIEGVTHALRTTEYNDRDEQYYWLQDAMRLRRVKIHSFSRMNFVQTELSKRKLTWFVDNKYVEGWNDPRFPTVQGVMRRGVSVEALRSFILSQGASRRTVLMEWDSFWAVNKKGYEVSAPRYMAVFAETAIKVEVVNGPQKPTGQLIPLHPKRPELGTRVLRLSNRILLEGQDAETIKEGEEITLTRWGNMKIFDISKDADGHITGMKAEYIPEGDPKKTEKKLTWLADVEDTVPIILTEFDYLITKKKFEEGEDFKDFINPVTKAEVPGIGDPCLRNLKKGEVVQLERRGFYICDRPYLGPDKPVILFMIPDGKTRAMSTLTGKLKHV